MYIWTVRIWKFTTEFYVGFELKTSINVGFVYSHLCICACFTFHTVEVVARVERERERECVCVFVCLFHCVPGTESSGATNLFLHQLIFLSPLSLVLLHM